jgi:protein ImuB
VQKFFTRRCYRVRTATAGTVGLAWALAHFEKRPGDEIRMTNEKTHSSFVIRHSSFPYFTLSVEALRIADDTAALLHELGIETVDQLLALPQESLASRFGDELLRRLDQLTRAEAELIEPHHAAPTFDANFTLDEPTADREVLMHVFEELVNQLSRQLAERGQGAVRLACALYSPGGLALPLEIGLLHPSANARQILELVELRLETVSLKEEVDRVEVRATVVGRLGERQRELFAQRRSDDPHQFALLVNRLSSRLGDGRVLRAHRRASPAPERAVQYVRSQEWESGRGREGEKKWQRSSRYLPLSPSPCLPLLLHERPHGIEVVSIAPDGPPQFVWREGRRERIVHHAGPERIETLWWRGRSVRRDYYRVATESGSHLWIFRRLSDARWFLHGEFA